MARRTPGEYPNPRKANTASMRRPGSVLPAPIANRADYAMRPRRAIYHSLRIGWRLAGRFATQIVTYCVEAADDPGIGTNVVCGGNWICLCRPVQFGVPTRHGSPV